VFISASIREVMPVAEIEGRAFEFGPAARDLQQKLRARATS
jgi:branched-subunit amino acid aminotransferase/4-amino-4-deoxychorismate lyase